MGENGGAVDHVVIGSNFAHQYYSKLTASPQDLHLFYKEDSTFTHGFENRGHCQSLTGLEEIQKKINSLDYEGSTVSISVLDSQPSLQGGILVVLMGLLTLRDQRPKKFAESFFLGFSTARWLLRAQPRLSLHR